MSKEKSDEKNGTIQHSPTNPSSISFDSILDKLTRARDLSLPYATLAVIYGINNSLYKKVPILPKATSIGVNSLILTFGIFFSENIIADAYSLKSSPITFGFGGICTGTLLGIFQDSYPFIPARAVGVGLVGLSIYGTESLWALFCGYLREQRLAQLRDPDYLNDKKWKKGARKRAAIKKIEKEGSK
mmetsp:Transcript_2586/g.3847  ORF Transcript_2586/g.3847 Transcript_2586/m.3847 type:complete len:187 (+) Transcript_2586:31-591(+)